MAELIGSKKASGCSLVREAKNVVSSTGDQENPAIIKVKIVP